MDEMPSELRSFQLVPSPGAISDRHPTVMCLCKFLVAASVYRVYIGVTFHFEQKSSRLQNLFWGRFCNSALARVSWQNTCLRLNKHWWYRGCFLLKRLRASLCAWKRGIDQLHSSVWPKHWLNLFPELTAIIYIILLQLVDLACVNDWL